MEKIEELKKRIEDLKGELQSYSIKDEKLQVLMHDLKDLEGKEFIKSNCNGRIIKHYKNGPDNFCRYKYIKTYPIKNEDTADLENIQCDAISISMENEVVKSFCYYTGFTIKSYDLAKYINPDTFQFILDDEFEEAKKKGIEFITNNLK